MQGWPDERGAIQSLDSDKLMLMPSLELHKSGDTYMAHDSFVKILHDIQGPKVPQGKLKTGKSMNPNPSYTPLKSLMIP